MTKSDQLNILRRIRVGSPFWKDVALVKEFSDDELVTILKIIIQRYPLKYDKIIEVVGDKVSPTRVGYLDGVQQFFSFLLTEGLDQNAGIEGYAKELKTLEFSEQFISSFTIIYKENEERLLSEKHLVEPDILGDICEFNWRIITITDDSITLGRNKRKIQIGIVYHTLSHGHKSISLEFGLSEFNDLYKEVSRIKEILNG